MTVRKDNDMLWISFAKWNRSCGRFFIFERYYKHGYKWTPLVKVSFRYLKIANS